MVWTHPLAHKFFGYITDLHYRKFISFFLTPLIVFICLLKFKKRAFIVLVGLIGSILLSEVLSHRVIKPIIQRERPTNQVEGAVLRTFRHSGWSLPSTHATNFFAGATFLYLFLPQWIGVGLFVLAILVSYSRVYLGVHYPLDITVGALLGMGISVCWYRGYGRLIAYMEKRNG